MKTYDYQQVSAVLAPLKKKFEDCTHGEGDRCDSLDKHLDCCASICLQVAGALKTWARAVFSGEVVFDPQAEILWRTELAQIHAQATRIWQIGRKAEVPCWELAGQAKLEAALWQLQWLLENWVSPKQAVGPAARTKLQLSPTDLDQMRQQLSSLPPFEPRVVSEH